MVITFFIKQKIKNKMKRGGINIRTYVDNQFEVQLSEMVLDNKESIIKIHKELLKGIPLTKQAYYQLSNLTKEKADEVLKKMGELDEQGNIIAFFGLSITPTKHRFIVNGKTLYTWCVVDAILFSEWLDISSHILTQDSIDGSFIELKIESDYLLWADPYPLFVSWVETMDSSNIRASFCNHVSFFASETTANQWIKDNPRGKILTIEEFFDYDKLGIKCC